MLARFNLHIAALLSGAALGLGLGAVACSHSKPKSDESEPPALTQKHELHHLIPYTLRVRRPAGPGADPDAGPGGTDYTSHPLPDARLDCETTTWLFKETALEKVRDCLETIKDPLSVAYRLRRLPAPYLELVKPDKAPACLVATLSRIPVPREIFFESNDEGPVLCYSSRMNIEADETAGLKLPKNRLNLVLNFPLETLPVSDDETRMVLLSWALTPLWGKGLASINSHIVPDAICNACLGQKNRLKPTDPMPPMWPQ